MPDKVYEVGTYNVDTSLVLQDIFWEEGDFEREMEGIGDQHLPRIMKNYACTVMDLGNRRLAWALAQEVLNRVDWEKAAELFVRERATCFGRHHCRKG